MSQTLQSLCIFGDSVTKGVIFDETRKKYVFLKECFVNLFAKQTGIQVDNYSKFGCTIKKGMDIVRRHIQDLIKYDYIALEFGGNDCNFDWAEIAAAPAAEHLPVTPIPEFKTSYSTLIEDIRNNGGKPLLLNLPPLDAQRFFSWVSKGISATNILSWLGDVDAIFRWHNNYNTAVQEIAQETGTPLIDIRSAFLKAGKYADLLCEDGMHPNSRGHALISQTIGAYVI